MIYTHFDRIGKQLTVGDIVVYPNGNHIDIGKIKKFNPKMLTITSVNPNDRKNYIKYPNDVIKLEGAEITMFLLQSC